VRRAIEKGHPRLKREGFSRSHGQGQRSLSTTTVGWPSRKFCMNRAPMAVVVTRLMARSRSGKPYSLRIKEIWTDLLAGSLRNSIWDDGSCTAVC